VTDQGSLPPRPPADWPADGQPSPDGEPYDQGYDQQRYDQLGPDGPESPRRSARNRRRGAQRRRWLIWGVPAAVVVLVAVIVVVLVVPGSKPASVTPGSLITTFLPGEIQKVPSACPAVPASTLSSYLPGPTKQAAPPPLYGAQDSQCNWTLDQRPTYRLLELDIRAETPSGLASGNGSATFAAIDAYASALQDKQNPAPNTDAPKAQVTVIKGLGMAAFTATQAYNIEGAVTDVATTVIRYKNVLITATLNGLDKSNHGDYGPVSMNQLSAGSLAVARAAFAKLPRS
jgi:hypothetical protein